ncbi:hypothetical protein B194_5158 [Serratia plymuthica A30]|uniref:hypothetical protein n=1 Tax=Serratia TaxID=613 RepID=UPI0002A2E281|nr:hypothetical protein [Serratia plymuthica]EKF61907.1 hypothetical protein B194_5158 [Serratia plymuthica A30]
MGDKAFLIHGVMLVHHQAIFEAVKQSHVAASISLDTLYSFVVVLLYKNFPSLFFDGEAGTIFLFICRSFYGI